MTNRRYTTDYLISTYLDEDVADEKVTPFVLATQKYIEQYTGRVFKADTAATERSYDGNGRQYLLIDDCVEVTVVKVGNDQWGDSQSTISASGTDRYYTLPTNNTAEEVPINKIGLRTRRFTYGHANHTITAKWGYSTAVPEDVQFAATVLASGMYYQNRGENTGAVKSEKIGEYSVSYADQQGFSDVQTAKAILDSYKKYEL